MKNNPIPLILSPIVVLGICLLPLITGCSVTSNLPQGEQLYIGRGKTKILQQDNSKEGQRAIAAAEAQINVAPNGALFGSPRSRLPIQFGLLFHNAFVNDSSFIGRKMYGVFASEPVLLSAVNTPVRSILALNTLREHGYFNAAIQDSIAFSGKDSLQAKAYYTFNMGNPYRYDSISYLPAWTFPNGWTYNHSELSTIRTGNQFNFAQIQADKESITSLLRDNGYYYFSPEMLQYEVDTVAVSGKAQMRIRLKEGLSTGGIKPWKIGKVTITVNGNIRETMRDSMLFEGVKVRYNQSIPIRKKVLTRRVFLRPDTYYSQTNEQNTLQALSRIGAFSYTDLSFVPVDTVNHILDLHVNSMLDKPWDMTIEALFKKKSNNFMGPGLSLSAARRNTFGGGERLSASLYGSYEWQNLKNIFRTTEGMNSYEFGTDLSLSAPAILLPGISDHLYPFPTTTDFTLSASMLHRARYFRMLSFGLSATYMFNRWMHHKHTITPLRLKYNMLSHRTTEFNDIMAKNTALALSLRSQFIPEISYTYTFDDIFLSRGSHHLWMEYSLSEAGNLVNAAYAIAGKGYNDTKKFLGVPFAQYVRLTGDVHYTYTITPTQTLAARIAGGAIFSYGNSTIAPYSEQFYVGGANSIRAFPVRSIGPGAYQPSTGQFAFIDQVGEFKLEANLEWRVRLLGSLHGALFLDAGNVWLLREDVSRPQGALSEIQRPSDFFNQIALGTGLGIRYDLGLLILRVDVGMGLHLPYSTSRQGYYNIPNFWDGMAYHFAIGYPF